MEEFRLGDQVAHYDREATVAAYSQLTSGGAERCNCVHCRNFAAQRNQLYPEGFRAVLHKLGIDPLKEGYVFDEVGPFPDKVRPTGGWFYFVGDLAESGEKLVSEGEFQYWFQPAFPRPPACFGNQIAAIEFRARIPWVLEEDPY
jgi:hypothetical protein